MVRPFLYETVLFLLPFAIYALWLVIRRVDVVDAETWRRAPILVLLLAALLTTGAGLALFGHFHAAPAGSVYVPAHVENGRLVEPELK
jgi:hypothetical protein